MERSDSKLHVVLLSSPGIGHLLPIFELGKHFVTLQDIEVTILVVASHASAAESEIIQSAMSQKQFRVIELPPVDISAIVDANEPGILTRIVPTMRETKPALRSAIYALERPPSVLIVDVFGIECLEIADKYIPRFVFMPSNATFLAMTLYLPFLDKMVEGQYVDQKEAFVIPGCVPLRPEDVADPMLDRNQKEYFEYLRMAMEIPKGDGILINTWEALEPASITALRDEKLLFRITKVPIFPIGPIVRPVEVGSSPSKSKKNEIFCWLDKQPDESVMFVSFGSGGTLSLEQTTEIAWALVLSQQRFLWVLRPPTVKTGGESFFKTESGGGGDDISSYLPDGFLARTQNVGLVVSHWAPQVEILSHPAVGGFFSHCGWNSTLESITNGVPMIAWPMYAEQRMNATMLAEEIGIAVRSKVLPTKGKVGREEIMMMVRRIMVDKEGDAIREKVKELKSSAEKAWKEDGGSSYNALAQVVEGWKLLNTQRQKSLVP